MTGASVLICVLVLLAVVLLLRVGVRVEYAGAPVIRLRIGPGYVQLVPAKRSDTEKRKKTDGKKSEPKTKRDTLELVRTFLPLVLRTVKRVCGKLQVDELDMVLTAGAKSPDEAAMQYGWANAVLGSLWQPIVDTCHVVDGRARVDIDFDATHPVIALQAEATLRVGQLLVLAVDFAVQALVILVRRTRTTPNEERRFFE